MSEESTIGEKIGAIITPIGGVLGGLLDGIKKQVSSATGALTLVVMVLVVLDVFKLGKDGTVVFLVTQITVIVTTIGTELYTHTWQWLGAGVVLLLILYRKHLTK